MKRRAGILIESGFILIVSFFIFLVFAKPEHPMSRGVSRFFSVTDIRLARPFFTFAQASLKSIGESARSFGKLLPRRAQKRPQCLVRVIEKPEEELQIGRDYEIVLEVSNTGADSTEHPEAFSGVHIEVMGADLKLISAKRDIRQSGDVKWVEMKLGKLKKNEAKKVVFSIRPKEKPVKIYYRGWIPGDFTEEMAREIKDELVNAYKDSGVWRNEEAISRFPENNSISSPLCLVKVKAAHKEEVHFRCAVLILK